jgi:hypothetical protein
MNLLKSYSSKRSGSRKHIFTFEFKIAEVKRLKVSPQNLEPSNIPYLIATKINISPKKLYLKRRTKSVLWLLWKVCLKFRFQSVNRPIKINFLTMKSPNSSGDSINKSIFPAWKQYVEYFVVPWKKKKPLMKPHTYYRYAD